MFTARDAGVSEIGKLSCREFNMQILMSLEHSQLFARSWLWTAISGIADLMLAGIIIAGWPGSVAWALGLLIGITLHVGLGAGDDCDYLPNRKQPVPEGQAGPRHDVTAAGMQGNQRCQSCERTVC